MFKVGGIRNMYLVVYSLHYVPFSMIRPEPPPWQLILHIAFSVVVCTIYKFDFKFNVGIRVRIVAQWTSFFFILLSGLQVTVWLIQGTQSITFTACPSQHTTKTTTLPVTVDHPGAAGGGLMLALMLTLTCPQNRGTGCGILSSLWEMYTAHLWW